MIRTDQPAGDTVTTTPAHVEIVADRYGVPVTIVGGYFYAVVVKPGRERATIWRAPVPADEVAS